MQIHNAILHKIDKEQGSSGSDNVQITIADAELPLDSVIQSVAQEARVLYTKNGPVYGVFEQDIDSYPFKLWLREAFDGNWAEFYEFSARATRRLAKLMQDTAASAGAYLMLLRYTESAQEFLLVMMMNDKIGAAVGEGLSLEQSIHLDMSKLFVAARINITKWSEQNENDDDDGHKYISFLKGRREIADYFVNFVGCSEIVKPLVQTRKIVDIITEFTQDFDKEKRDRVKEVASDYLRGRAVERAEASLETLSLLISEESPDEFFEFATSEQNAMSSYFMVDRGATARLVGVNYRDSALSIRMSTAFVRSNVHLNDNTITLENAPDELIAEVRQLV